MRSDQQILINGLLLQREELFLRIHELESAADAILGEPYPFVRPILPSDNRGKRKPGSQGRAAVLGKDPLRRLESGETAFRVTYRRFGQTVHEDHDEVDALRSLLLAQGKTLSVTRIETIDFAGHTKAVLLDRAETSATG